jgi:hypothetical protein
LRLPTTDEWLNSKTLEKIVQAVQATTIIAKKKHDFRVSSLPYCPLLELVARKELEQTEEMEYDSHFYFAIGNALHSLFQKFSRDAKGVTLIGDWKCSKIISIKQDSNPPSETITKCAQAYQFCSNKSAKKRHSCPHKLKDCKGDFEYVELTLYYNGLSGHCDLLFKVDGKYYLVDIKTTSTFLFDSTKLALDKGYYPAKKYFHQIESYAVMLEKQFDIKIEQYAILYVSRDRTSTKRKGHMLFVRKLNNRMRRERWELLDKQTANNKLVEKYEKSQSKKLLTKIWENRPCQKPSDYKNEMGPKFFDKVCTFHKDKTCYSGKIIKTIEKMYSNKTASI